MREHADYGVVASVRGSVVDAWFEKRLPPMHALLRAGTGSRVAIEVLMQLDTHHVRGIALNPTRDLVPGMAVVDTGGRLKAPDGSVSQMVEVFGDACDQ
jgi:F-type H+-transporting ATPase subunit beta